MIFHRFFWFFIDFLQRQRRGTRWARGLLRVQNPPKLMKNRWKIDGKMASILDSIFWSIFDRFPPDSVRKWSQHGPNLGPKMEPKWSKNWWKNRLKIWCLLGLIFERILVDFGRENGGKLAPKWNQKSILTCNRRKSLKCSKTNGISMIFVASGVEVGSQNRLKINQKIKSKMEGILASIFHRF